MLRDGEDASGRRGTINWGDEIEQEEGQIVLSLVNCLLVYHLY